MIVRELISRFGFKVEKKSFQKANDGFAKLKKVATALATVLVAGKVANAIRGIATETAALGDQIDKVSEKLGVNAQALQELRFAAGQTGVAQQTLDMALQRFARRSAEAARGTGEAKDALRELGVRLRDSAGKLRPVEELLGDVAEGMRRTKGDGDRLRLAFKLFDSEGAALVTTLKGGRGALEDLRRKARETGGVLDEELIAASVEYTDTQHELSLVIRGFKNLLAKQLLPVFTRSAQGIMAWLKVNRAFIAQKFSHVIRRIIEVVSALTKAVWRVASAIYDWAKSLDPLSRKILTASVALGVLAVALMSPVATAVLLIALVGIIIDDFTAWWENTGKVSTAMDRLDQALGGALGVMRDMIKSGEDLKIMETAFEYWGDQVKRLVGYIADLGRGLAGLDLGLLGSWVFGGMTPEDERAARKREQLLAQFEQRYAEAVARRRAAVAAPAAVTGGTAVSASVSIGNLNVQAAPGETVTEQTRGAVARVAREEFEDTLRQTIRTVSPATP